MNKQHGTAAEDSTPVTSPSKPALAIAIAKMQEALAIIDQAHLTLVATRLQWAIDLATAEHARHGGGD